MHGIKLTLALSGLCIAICLVQNASAKDKCRYKGRVIEKRGALTALQGQCFMITCNPKGKIEKIECFETEPRAGCHSSGYDLTKIYPQCCPHEVCPQDIDVAYLN